MSFRGRMLLFFVIIVVIPMVALFYVLGELVGESEVGRADSELAAGLRVAAQLYEEARGDALDDLRQVANDPLLQRAFVDRDPRRLDVAVSRAVSGPSPVDSVLLFDREGNEIAGAGAPEALAYATGTATGPSGRPIGEIAVSTTTSPAYATAVSRLTGLDVRVARGDDVLATTLGGAEPAGPDETLIGEGEDQFRGRYTILRDAAGPPVAVGVFQPTADLAAAVDDNRKLVGAILIGFFLLAVASSLLIVRSLGSQIARFLGAARSVGRGEFAARVPARGRDEFAALGREFNVMAERLEENAEELERRQAERERSIRRVGEAFAAGLDRRGIIQLTARTALEACAAEAGRAALIGPEPADSLRVGSDDPELGDALNVAERAAEERPGDVTTATREDVEALATTLRSGPEADGRRHALGHLAIARRGQRFDDAERDVFAYLAAQASVSLDNVRLHQAVQSEAVTDPLTGLSNRRRFDAALHAEIGRSRRFGDEVGLVMVDLDGFKPVNDGYGHQQGDQVLIEVAALLRGLTRDVDHLARYGGDELAVILPQTDLDGASFLAERIRAGIEELGFTPPDGRAPFSVTASIGVSAMPETASDRDGLVRSADAALYRAKRGGGNRVERADPVAVPR